VREARRKTSYERLFSKRTGRIGFLFYLPIIVVLLFFPIVSIIATILFAGLVVTWLNDHIIAQLRGCRGGPPHHVSRRLSS